jgi:hypothetical protein
MTVALAPVPKFQALGFGGLPLPGGKLFTFIAGTSTPQATYTDSTKTQQNQNPIIMDANGQADVWLVVGQTYKLQLTDFFGNQIWVVDQIPGGQSITQNIIGLLLYPITPAENIAGVTPTNFIYSPGDFRRYGGDGTGTLDSTAAINQSISVAQQSFAASGLTFSTIGDHAPVAGASVIGPGSISLSGGPNPIFSITASNIYIGRLSMSCTASAGSKVAISINGNASGIEISDCVLTQARILTTGTNSFIKILRNTTTGSCVGGISGATINIAAGGSCSNFNVSDNNCSGSDGAGIGVFNNSLYGNISNNQSVGNAGAGFLLQSGQYMMISENVALNNLQPGFSFQPTVGGSLFAQRSVLVGNVAKGNGFDGFDINCATSGQAFAYLEVTGNYAESNGTNINGGTGFNIEGVSLSAFTGNMAFSNNTNGYNIQAGTGLTFTGNQAIANGIGSTNAYAGIFLNGASNCVVIGNVSTNTSGGATQSYGIQESGSSDFNYFSGNQLQNNVTGQIFTVGAHSIFEPQQITASAQALVNSATIANAGFRILRCTAAAAVTGITLAPGSYFGQQVVVINESTGANTITMASGGSNVADGSNCIIAGLTQKSFFWDNGTSLWYHS